ncbi:PREDICTED: LOC110761954 [Prunus dulcis]|uniref:PREDICTED: LOC110761954 n=1 Tax=Prunus dulcis TaxID=3755 RepID=A0A5E4GFH6_PRUDU|nr:PREDICTED: LOC110761954 [Prunus dulcis]
MENARRREPRLRSSSQSNSQVTVLTATVAELKGQLSVLLESLARSSIPIQHFGPSSTSKPLQPEHGHHTFALVDNLQTSEPHLPDDQVDFGTLFD